MYGLHRMVADLAHRQSHDLKRVLSTVYRAASSELLRQVSDLQADIADEVEFMLGAMWRRLPFTAIGIFGEALGVHRCPHQQVHCTPLVRMRWH